MDVRKTARSAREKLRNRYAQAGVVVTGTGLAGTASATEPTGGTLDVSTVTSYISGTLQDGINGVGGAVIAVAVAAMAFKWIKGMIFS